MEQQCKIGNSYASSSGGTITVTSKGLVHSAGKRYNAIETSVLGTDGEGNVQEKRKPGRPKKTDIQFNM